MCALNSGERGPEEMAVERPVVAVDVGGTKIATALVTRSGERTFAATCPTPLSTDAAIIDRIEQMVSSLIDTAPVPVVGIGIGLPGVVDDRSGVAIAAANLPFLATPIAPRL